ncbi:hypothetical protein LK459_03905 [Gordonia otitidis]|uniref:hypothetical protein n=1 Tax=Gordonia otitidis TaxID=249058 RepID=UPI001D133DA1|nr:hypothetical protein [Gordonia otitidis]UEA60036.1 hypothetical protein LK459_03905 [Gordonia otitidis]
MPFPITDGIDYISEGHSAPLNGTWGGAQAPDVTGSDEMTYTNTGPKTGRVDFYDTIRPVGTGSTKTTSNKIGVWVNGKDVTDQAQITRTGNGIRGSINVSETDTVLVRHQMTTQWTDQAGTAQLDRANNTDIEGIVKVANDHNVMEDAHSIAYNSHSWAAHEGQIPGVTTQNDYENMIYKTMRWAPPQDHKTLPRGREAWWDGQRGVIVIYDGWSQDAGTAFRPDDGRAYFDKLKGV